ncbi:MAG: adenine phosphoribosyltransferase [Succinivibrionaceae bacterium]|nr:adenine phosphoribosyltransferase [Succinivibrionaceae bacterium]
MRKEDYDYIVGSVTSIPNFPKRGVLFRDITSLIEDAKAFNLAIDAMAEKYANSGYVKIMAAEARGFIFGAALAARIGAGIVMVRKPGKLPRETLSEEYTLEYGSSILQCHKDSIDTGDKVLIVDDLLATGGTALAMLSLARCLGADVSEACFAICLKDLPGRRLLKEHSVEAFSLIDYSGD